MQQPVLSSATRAQLRQIAHSLRQLRHGNADSPDNFRLQIGLPASQPLEIEVSSEALDRIAQVIGEASGERDELTTQQAAALLGVSRPYFIKLLEADKIPYRRVGHYRRVRREDVVKFEIEEQARRRAGLNELATLTQEIGLPY